MKTEKGRIVYNREVHFFSSNDIIRILNSIYENKTWRESSRLFGTMIAEFLRNYDVSIKNSIYTQLVIIQSIAAFYRLGIEDIINFIKNLNDQISLGTEPGIDEYFIV